MAPQSALAFASVDSSLPGMVLVAGNVARLRLIRNLSAESLAQRLGWTAAKVGALETADVADLALDDIDNLAQALDVEPAALFA